VALIIDPAASLTLGQAVGNILSALVDAQARAARTTVDFIEDVGFQAAAVATDPPTLRRVEFSYTKRDENDDEAVFEVSLPLLGLVDIPLIAIKRAKIDLEFEVSSVSEPSQGPSPLPLPRPLPPSAVPVIKGRVLTGRTSSVDQRGTIKVSVEVEKADMPPGLSRALDVLEVAAREKKSGPGS
jgi:hypothetical protein